MIKLSVAAVTRNRSEILSNMLFSLSLQNVQPYEIIISDDSDNPASVEANKKLANQYNCCYLAGPKKGLYANRNFVAKHITGTHFHTMDDDHEFPENHIAECIKAIEAEPDTIWTIGEYTLRTRQKMDTIDFPVAGQLHPKGYSYFNGNINAYYGISCGATLYPKKVVQNNDLNAEYYKFGIAYLEYGAMLKYKNYILKPLTSTYILHNNADTNASGTKKNLLNEAKAFSVMCLSFKYKKSGYNILNTSAMLVTYLVLGKLSFKALKNAYTNFKVRTAHI